MHQLQRQAHPLGQAGVDFRRAGRGVTHYTRTVTGQHLLNRPAQRRATAVFEQRQHHVQRTAGTCAAHAATVQHMGLTADAHLGEQFVHHRPAIGVEGAVMIVEQAGLGQEVSAVPQPAQLAAVLVGLA